MVRRWTIVGVVLSLLAGISAWQTVEAEEPETCAPPAPGAPMFVTETCVDPRFNDGYAFIDIDEVRDAPVPHRFVHGGFTGTDARFAFYFPADDQYEGRFIQGPIHQLRLTSEIASNDEIQFAFDSGAYLIETNNGGYESCLTARDCLNHPEKYDAAVRGYRVNAAAVKFSRTVAQRVYGREHRPFGYLYGGSGGAYMTVSSAENTKGVWDGYVPFVFGHPLAIPDHYTVRINALRVLRERDKLTCIMDAVEPGGSGDPFASCDMNEVEAQAFREATRLGFPPLGWANHATMDGSALPLVANYVPLTDPTYVEDFWSKPGYLGTEQSAAGVSVRKARIQHGSSVLAAFTDVPILQVPYESMGPAYNYYMVGQYVTGLPPKALKLESLPPEGSLEGADLVLTSGEGAGGSCPLSVLDRGAALVTCGGNSDPAVVNAIGTGDEVLIDNSMYLALQTHHRHQVPADPDYYGWDQFRKGKAGQPIYPQRETLVGPIGAFNASGSVNTGKFHGKMLMVENVLDQDAFAWSADWYRRKVVDNRREGDFRVWFNANAIHAGTIDAVHTIDYTGILQQALRDVAAWVEQGTPPPASTNYRVGGFWDADEAQIQLPVTAAERLGVQPVVDLIVRGRQRYDRADIAAGDTVDFKGLVEVPPGAGEIACIGWNFEAPFMPPKSPTPKVFIADPGSSLPEPSTLSATETCGLSGTKMVVETSHEYTEPGTYFAVLTATAQRKPADAWAEVQNLARVRIVVG
jgi:hypothetical protein